MMRIEHFALYVQDLNTIKSFYEKYFDASANTLYHNPKTGLKTYFLSFPGGGRLEIMTRPDMVSVEKDIKNTGYIHLAFSAGSKENVDNLTDLLRNDGYRIISGPRMTGDGSYESCVLDPEDNQIEIVE